MVMEQPKWLQNGVYPARLDRHVIEELFRSENRVIRGLQVTQASPADFTVNISAGVAVILGTTEADQGAYMVRSTATENIAVAGTPVSARIDSIYAVVNDPTAGGPSGDDFEFVYVENGDPVPDDSVLLADITRQPSESSIGTAAITDRRPLGEWSWTVGTAPPTHRAPNGDLYVQVES